MGFRPQNKINYKIVKINAHKELFMLNANGL